MVLCPKEIDSKTDPAGDKDEHRADDLSDDGHRFLEDVEHCKDRQDEADDVDY